jgi:prepilin-type N-terminal cleavage/methylation domain-containing protein
MDDEAGFTLLEIICVLAIVGLLAAVALPHFPKGTTRTRLARHRGAPQGRPERRHQNRNSRRHDAQRRGPDCTIGRHRRDRAAAGGRRLRRDTSQTVRRSPRRDDDRFLPFGNVVRWNHCHFAPGRRLPDQGELAHGRRRNCCGRQIRQILVSREARDSRWSRRSRR